MKPIIIIKPKSLSAHDKRILLKEGLIVIEHENPNEIKTLNHLSPIDDNEVLIASVQSILNNNYSDNAKKLFGENLLRLIQKRVKTENNS